MMTLGGAGVPAAGLGETESRSVERTPCTAGLEVGGS